MIYAVAIVAIRNIGTLVETNVSAITFYCTSETSAKRTISAKSIELFPPAQGYHSHRTSYVTVPMQAIDMYIQDNTDIVERIR